MVGFNRIRNHCHLPCALNLPLVFLLLIVTLLSCVVHRAFVHAVRCFEIFFRIVFRSARLAGPGSRQK